jgi:hypothetical protein
MSAFFTTDEGFKMWLALLYDRNGRLSAAAPACDQHALGNRYWNEVYPEPVNTRGSETRYANIDDPVLLERLLKMAFRDDIESSEAVEPYLPATS